jgi:hypothetical protein
VTRPIFAKLEYPRTDRNPDHIRVSLIDVRAADDLLIHYDFDRDGWSIEQASRWEWAEGEEIDEDWQEVAFVPAWGRDPGEVIHKGTNVQG